LSGEVSLIDRVDIMQLIVRLSDMTGITLSQDALSELAIIEHTHLQPQSPGTYFEFVTSDIQSISATVTSVNI
jgi:hypothetical protein